MAKKGLLTPEQELFVAELLDNTIHFKNPILEGLDSSVFRILLSLVDDNLMAKVPEDWQNPIGPIIDAAIAEDWDAVQEAVVGLLNGKIDIPLLDEESEKLIFTSVLGFILGLLLSKLEEFKREEKENEGN